MPQYDQGPANAEQQQEWPGTNKGLDPEPANAELLDGPYRAAGKLKGKRALITGGDSGIGKSVAILFAKEGADVCINYLAEEEDDAQQTRKDVEREGVKCYLTPGDLRTADTCRKMVDFAHEKLGGLDILVNNAAYQMQQKDILDISDEQWDRTFKTNVYSIFWITKQALRYLKRGSVIVNNASVNAYIGRDDLLDYTSTKGAIVSLTRGLANALLAKGIRVNAVAPGPVQTPMVAATFDKDSIAQTDAVPMGRPGMPVEIGTVFVFLACSDSSYITGQVIHANGGAFVTT